VSSRRDFKDTGGKSRGRSRKGGSAAGKGAQRSTPGWVWLLTGLLAGLFVAGLVYLRKAPAPAPQARQAPQRPARPSKTAAKPKVPAPVAEEQRFDFYDLLPQMEVEVPKESAAGKTAGKTGESGSKTAAPRPRFVLQAGSFRTAAQADRLKARLTLLGFEPKVQTVTINGSSTWHRVILGPFDSEKAVNDARARLWTQKINTVPMRVAR